MTPDYIRLATVHDCAAVYSLICEMEEKELPFSDFESIYQSQCADENYYCLVYESEHRVVGCINLRMEFQLHHAARICEIMELAVSSSCRCGGLGTKLFRAACVKAKECGCCQIEVCCNQLRTRTHQFYSRQGMHNFHYKFSMNLLHEDDGENRLGR